MLREFKLPDVGEGLTEADIVAWHVKPGDQVEDGQIIVEIETAKAVVELPCPWDGTVSRLLAEEGQTVEVGVPITAAGRPETAEVPTTSEVPVEPLELATQRRAAEPGVPAARALAKPPVRKLAKDLGISLAELAGSGPDGSI